MAHDKQMMSIAAELDAALKPHQKASLEAALGPADLCKTYNQIKPILQKALVIIKLFPWGGAVASAIELLMSIADKLCPAG